MEVNTLKIQILLLVFSIGFFISIFILVKNQKIKVKYSLLWFFVSIIMIFMSIYRSLFDKLAMFLGIGYPPSLIIILLLFLFVLFLLYFTIIISKLSEKINILSQEIALLKNKIEKSE